MSYPQIIIPIQLTLLGMHGLSQSFSKAVVHTIAVKVLGMLQHTNPFLIELEVDIERLWFSLAVKMPNFWGPKKDKKVINSSTKCLISVKIAIMTRHIIPLPLVNVWLIFDLQKYVQLTLVYFRKSIRAFKKHRSFVWSTASCRSIQCCMYPIPWYQTIILWARNFQVQKGTMLQKKAW